MEFKRGGQHGSVWPSGKIQSPLQVFRFTAGHAAALGQIAEKWRPPKADLE
jgi:hypothetical protein